MTFNNPWVIGLAVIVVLQGIVLGNLAMRQKADEKSAVKKVAPAKLEAIAGSKLLRVTLTPKAAERLGVKTVKLTDSAFTEGRAVVASASATAPAATAGERRSVPYSSLLYDLDGSTWVYKEVAPLSYERHRIEINSIAGDHVFIKSGPPAGTVVVSEGAIEIFGAETKVGH